MASLLHQRIAPFIFCDYFFREWLSKFIVPDEPRLEIFNLLCIDDFVKELFTIFYSLERKGTRANKCNGLPIRQIENIHIGVKRVACVNMEGDASLVVAPDPF